MGRKPSGKRLNVFMNSRLVGVLTSEKSGALSFEYDADWLGWEHAMPISRSVPLREDTYVGGPIFYVLDNLLPDSVEIRRHIAARVKADDIKAYSLLSKIGRDCVGALQFLPDGDSPGAPGQVDVVPADDARIGELLRNLGRAPLGVTDDDEFRISIAGAQEKTALTLVDGTWCFPRGSTATTHILKPTIGLLPNGWDFSLSVENEWFCLALLDRFGLPAPKAKICHFDGKKVLVVERFDRKWTSDGRLLRIPQEDMLQAKGMSRNQKYEEEGGPTMAEIFEILRASDNPEGDTAMLFKAKMLYWMLAATDCHAKNYSIFLMPGGRSRLAPFYDVASAQPNYDAGQVGSGLVKMAMAVNGRFRVEEITHDDWHEAARKCGVPPITVLDTMDSIIAAAPGVIEAQMASLPDDFPHVLAASIIGGLERRLLAIKNAMVPGGVVVGTELTVPFDRRLPSPP